MCESRRMMTRRLVATGTVAALLVLDAGAAAFAADPTYPTGTFTLERTSAYIHYNPYDDALPIAFINVRRSNLSDDETAPADIVTALDPGDGGALRSCTTDLCSFVYSGPGTFTPKARLTDEDGNTNVITLPQVRILEDLTAPTSRVTAPKPRLRNKRSAWRIIRGTASDTGVGVNWVKVIVLQKRHGWWYLYTPFQQKKWRKGLRTEAATNEKFHPVGGDTIATGPNSWRTPRIKRLTRGPIVVRLWAADLNENSSRPSIAARSRITRR